VEGRGWVGGKGGEMTQALYAHMNKKKKTKGLVCNSVVEHLPCMCNALDLIPSTATTTEKMWLTYFCWIVVDKYIARLNKKIYVTRKVDSLESLGRTVMNHSEYANIANSLQKYTFHDFDIAF
jgi:hypothetical protein